MSTIQIWVTEDDLETSRRLKNFLEHQQEEEFEGKSYRLSSRYYRRGKKRRKRIRRQKINHSYIFRQALNLYWLENEQTIVDFEKSNKYR